MSQAPQKLFTRRFYQWLEQVYDELTGDQDPLNKECILNCVIKLTYQYVQRHPELWTHETIKAPALTALWIADKQFGLVESEGRLFASDLAKECNCSEGLLLALEREILEANDYVVCGGLQGCTRAEQFMRPGWAPPLRTRRATIGGRAEPESEQMTFMSPRAPPKRRHSLSTVHWF